MQHTGIISRCIPAKTDLGAALMPGSGAVKRQRAPRKNQAQNTTLWDHCNLHGDAPPRVRRAPASDAIPDRTSIQRSGELSWKRAGICDTACLLWH